ncbi:MAG: hypothetical protein Ct9H300mP1_25250 [Planctomycetaceae bacterium]|nr:MAG: hypothetical protein Ct9H300mP1_25250 [Planctomycetaceae bacterium]
MRLSAIADKFSVVRSVKHNQNNHGAGNHYMMTGSPTRIPVSCGAFVSFHPSMGSVVSSQRGAENGLPPYFSFRRKLDREAPTSWGLGMLRLSWPMTRTPRHSRFVT